MPLKEDLTKEIILKKKRILKMSESLIVAVLLTITGGYLDVYTYITRGGVFANAQTGNIVLLGINIANNNWKTSFQYLIPILSFVLGVFLSELLKKTFYIKRKLHWRQLVVLFEIFILIFVSTLKGHSHDILANVLISFVCSLQVETFRKFHENTFASTMCTGNLRSASENLYKFLVSKNKFYLFNFIKYIGIIISFISGAIISLKVTNILGTNSVLICCIILFIAFLLMFLDKKSRILKFKILLFLFYL